MATYLQTAVLAQHRLPDFSSQANPADALRQWTHGLFYIDFSGMWVQLWVCAGCISAMVLFVSFGIIAPRIRDGTFWIVRTLHKPDGVLWVPNSMMGFVAFAGSFGIILVVWYGMLYRWFKYGQEPTTFWLFFCLCWLPLFSAVVIATLGLYYSLPPRFSSSIHRQSSVMFKPMVLNLCALALPVFEAVAILVPACITHTKYLKSLHMYREWKLKYASQAEITQDMLVDAQQCWHSLFPVFKTARICFWIWTAFVAIDVTCYILLSLRMIFVLRAQLQRSRKRTTWLDTEPSPPFASKPLLNCASPLTGRSATLSPDSGQALSPLARGSLLFSKVNKSHIVHRQAPRFDANSQLRYLRIVLYHVVVQLLAIGPGLIIYGFVSCFLAVKLPSMIEAHDEKPWGEHLTRPLLIVSYTSIVVGTVILFSIAKRTYDYEPVGNHQRELKAERNVGKNPRRVSRGNRADLAECESPQDKGGRNMTTFFESETVQRPAATVQAAASLHNMPDLERSGSRANQLGLDLHVGAHRRFSQTIVIADESEHLNSVHQINQGDLDVPSSPRSARFALLRRLSGTTVPLAEESRSRSRSQSASPFGSPMHRMRSLSRSSRTFMPA